MEMWNLISKTILKGTALPNFVLLLCLVDSDTSCAALIYTDVFWCIFLFFSLKFINIAMVTILKNVTNILTAIGELYLFRKRQNPKVWTAMFLMVNSILTSYSLKCFCFRQIWVSLLVRRPCVWKASNVFIFESWMSASSCHMKISCACSSKTLNRQAILS